MTWNHRIVFDSEQRTFEIREVYYDSNGVPAGHCEAAAVYSQDDDGGPLHDSLRRQLAQMAAAVDRPVLILSDFTGDLFTEISVLGHTLTLDELRELVGL